MSYYFKNFHLYTYTYININIFFYETSETIAVKEENIAKIAEVIDGVQSRALVRKINARDIMAAISKIEGRLFFIPKKYWKGTIATVDLHHQTFPKAYKGSPEATYFEVTYKSNSWYLTDVYRYYCKNREIELKLPDALKEAVKGYAMEYLETGLAAGRY